MAAAELLHNYCCAPLLFLFVAVSGAGRWHGSQRWTWQRTANRHKKLNHCPCTQSVQAHPRRIALHNKRDGQKGKRSCPTAATINELVKWKMNSCINETRTLFTSVTLKDVNRFPWPTSNRVGIEYTTLPMSSLLCAVSFNTNKIYFPWAVDGLCGRFFSTALLPVFNFSFCRLWHSDRQCQPGSSVAQEKFAWLDWFLCGRTIIY